MTLDEASGEAAGSSEDSDSTGARVFIGVLVGAGGMLVGVGGVLVGAGGMLVGRWGLGSVPGRVQEGPKGRQSMVGNMLLKTPPSAPDQKVSPGGVGEASHHPHQ